MKHSLAEGRYEGGMLPSYRQLTKELNVAKASVQQAMAELEREGLIRREKGRGVFPRTKHRSSVSEKRLPIQCVNFVTRSFALLPSFVGADYLAGYTEALDPLNIRMRFVATNELDPDHSQLCSSFLPTQSQGVIFINEYPAGLVEWLQLNNMPFVAQYSARPEIHDTPEHFAVHVNKPGGVFQAVNHLAELGHHRIGFMGYVHADPEFDPIGDPISSSMPVMFEGYRAALLYAGLGYSRDWAVHCFTGDRQASFVIAKKLLERPKRPTAVLASCDDFALALLEAARTLNIRVPEDLSIVGFDNHPKSSLSHPPLTTVSVPRRELAKNSVELFLEAARDPSATPQMRVLDTHLIIRETTAPPKAARPNSPAKTLRDKP